MLSPKEQSDKEIVSRLANTYQGLALYWMGSRAVMGYQTVEYISNQAAYCTMLAVHYSRIDRMLKDIAS